MFCYEEVLCVYFNFITQNYKRKWILKDQYLIKSIQLTFQDILFFKKNVCVVCLYVDMCSWVQMCGGLKAGDHPLELQSTGPRGAESELRSARAIHALHCWATFPDPSSGHSWMKCLFPWCCGSKDMRKSPVRCCSPGVQEEASSFILPYKSPHRVKGVIIIKRVSSPNSLKMSQGHFRVTDRTEKHWDTVTSTLAANFSSPSDWRQQILYWTRHRLSASGLLFSALYLQWIFFQLLPISLSLLQSYKRNRSSLL